MDQSKFAVTISLSKACLLDFKYLRLSPEQFISQVIRQVVYNLSNGAMVRPDNEGYGGVYIYCKTQKIFISEQNVTGKVMLKYLDNLSDCNMIIPYYNVSVRDREQILSILSAKNIALFSFELPRFDNMLYFQCLEKNNGANQSCYYSNEMLMTVLTSIAANLITDLIEELIKHIVTL